MVPEYDYAALQGEVPTASRWDAGFGRPIASGELRTCDQNGQEQSL